jgi:cell division protease FtsH
MRTSNDLKKYPFSRPYYEKYIKKLNSANITDELLHNDLFDNVFDQTNRTSDSLPRVRVIMNRNPFQGLFGSSPRIQIQNGNGGNYYDDGDDDDEDDDDSYYKKKSKKSENFEVLKTSDITFADIGGYTNIKEELKQCVDLLKNYNKYSRFNVRIPKGLILEGPPGNGKTLLAKGLAGEAKVGFIAVSGSEFQDKYVGVGSSRVRELFALAKKNIPCIIFIDEIDALGRTRGNDGETASSERDSTLNELLVALDGFKNASGIFVVGATNRADLLDDALLRPGRIDKRIYIDNPDEKTRESILNIHLKGKPMDSEIKLVDLIDLTNGYSGAQIENLLNEAMLNALRYDREVFSMEDIDIIFNKMLAGWQPNEHSFSNDIIDHIAIHEMGHVVVGLVAKHHAKMRKVIINLSSPTSPAYTIFESPDSTIYTREALFEHLMILLGGRIAEEVFYGVSVTTGAINDFEEALKLAEKMVLYYGLGEDLIYPSNSDKYKEKIDNSVSALLKEAYVYAEYIIQSTKEFITDGAELLKRDKIIHYEKFIEMIHEKYSDVFDSMNL